MDTQETEQSSAIVYIGTALAIIIVIVLIYFALRPYYDSYSGGTSSELDKLIMAIYHRQTANISGRR